MAMIILKPCFISSIVMSRGLDKANTTINVKIRALKKLPIFPPDVCHNKYKSISLFLSKKWVFCKFFWEISYNFDVCIFIA